MRLELDVGNTRLKWRYMSEEGRVDKEGFLGVENDAFEFFIKNSRFNAVTKLLVSDVAAREDISALCQHYEPVIGGDNIFIAKSESKLKGVTFAYEKIERLGVDRCLAMVAGYQKYPDGVLVVDCGSAITADIVSSKGVHVGGYIIPGLQLIRSSLLKGTADIKAKDNLTQSCLPGVSTEECVAHGINTMLRSSLMAFMTWAQEYGIKRFLLTGGDAAYIHSLGLSGFINSKNLVFQGLELVSPYIFSEFTSVGSGGK